MFVSLVLGASGGTLSAQAIKIKLVNGKSGRPLDNTFVNTWVGTEQKEAIAIPTDKSGVALLYLTDKDAEVNIQASRKVAAILGQSILSSNTQIPSGSLLAMSYVGRTRPITRGWPRWHSRPKK